MNELTGELEDDGSVPIVSSRDDVETYGNTKDEEPISFAAKVWDTLAHIDCSEHVKQKGDFSYLSWTWAWGILMQNYPESDYVIESVDAFDDGTVRVWTTVMVREGDSILSRRMWLPVMSFNNQAVSAPNSMQISNSTMRCLTKNIAMFGLGHHIYCNEDIPREDDAVQVHRFKSGEKEKIVTQVMACLENDDAMGAQEIFDEYADDPQVKVKVWFLFDSTTRSSLTKLLEPIYKERIAPALERERIDSST